jgi:hypothetical protein
VHGPSRAKTVNGNLNPATALTRRPLSRSFDAAADHRCCDLDEGSVEQVGLAIRHGGTVLAGLDMAVCPQGSSFVWGDTAGTARLGGVHLTVEFDAVDRVVAAEHLPVGLPNDA